MSQEFSELRSNVLIGFQDTRGYAWWAKQDPAMRLGANGEPNHYPGAIPVEDAVSRIFNWKAEESALYMPRNVCVNTLDGADMVPVPNRKAMRRSDTGAVLGIFRDGYKGHDYDEWLIKNFSTLVGDELGLATVGTIRGGARAWVTIERPDSVETPDGVVMRPYLMAATSFDGSLATVYKCCANLAVCDNTFAIALAEDGQRYSVRHSKYSDIKISEARDALQIIYAATDDFSAQVSEWCATPVTDKQFDQVLNSLIPVPEDEGRGKTRAENRQTDIRAMYHGDPRCEPWEGTKFGVVQTFNTYLQHAATQKGGVHRAERNIDNALSGKIEAHDANVIAAVDAVLA